MSMLISMLCLLLTAGPNAAMKSFCWQAHAVCFDLPSDFKVTHNAGEEFEAAGDGDMSFGMSVMDGAITLEEMNDATLSAAAGIGLQIVDAVKEIHTSEFQGAYVEGYKDGYRVMFAGVIDPNSTTNFWVRITFPDHDSVAEEDAFKILNSIRIG